MKNYLNGTIFLAIVACWLWSTSFAATKIGLQYQPPLQFAGLRFIIAGAALFVVFGDRKKFFREVASNFRFLLFLSIIQVFLEYAFFYLGMDLVPGALAAMIVGSGPLFVAIIAHFSFDDDKLGWKKVVSILLGLVGMVIITLGSKKMDGGSNLILTGILLLIGNNLLSGYSNILISKRSAGISPMVLASTSLFIGGWMLFSVSIPTEGIHLGPFPQSYYISLAWLSFISAAAFTLWYKILQRPGVKVSEINIWKFLIPVSGAILSWLLVKGESPDLISIAGMVFIAGALLMLNYNNRMQRNEVTGGV
jgi:drug/metabolite transporter (DMT)-like permease